MLLLEKLRALCQQMKEYEFSSHPTARARDFYDIHLVLTKTGTDLSTEENADRRLVEPAGVSGRADRADDPR